MIHSDIANDNTELQEMLNSWGNFAILIPE